jgi:hypothetical protein
MARCESLSLDPAACFRHKRVFALMPAISGFFLPGLRKSALGVGRAGATVAWVPDGVPLTAEAGAAEAEEELPTIPLGAEEGAVAAGRAAPCAHYQVREVNLRDYYEANK